MNPYQVLGVRKNYKTKTIRKAYLKLSKQHHPDKGGDRDRFEEIQFAWEILRDEKLRKRYDETGEIPKSRDMHKYAEEDTDRKQVLIHAIACFQGVLHNNDPVHTDIIDACKKVMNKNIKEAETKIASTTKDLGLYDDILKRLKCKSDSDPLRSSVIQQKDVVQKAIHEQTELLGTLQKALVLFDDYEYSCDSVKYGSIMDYCSSYVNISLG